MQPTFQTGLGQGQLNLLYLQLIIIFHCSIVCNFTPINLLPLGYLQVSIKRYKISTHTFRNISTNLILSFFLIFLC